MHTIAGSREKEVTHTEKVFGKKEERRVRPVGEHHQIVDMPGNWTMSLDNASPTVGMFSFLILSFRSNTQTLDDLFLIYAGITFTVKY